MSDEMIVEGDAAKQDRIEREQKNEVQEQIKQSRDNVPEYIILLSIAFDTRTNNIQVAGPLMDKLMCYKMLEGARDCIYDYNREHIAGVKN